ncbi:MAG TPA: c-type cytochrome biogenesis protein CcmI, partial [Hypericibacter adhaerens]|uniref:c-type cytochrome biogenesis protein CcmI n=1 Tax=Hypericibacter adhaerens TaxID=2602016 RepID=UPI002BDDAF7B
RCIFCRNVSIGGAADTVPRTLEAMTIWLLALLLTAIACASLYYAGAGRTVNAGPSVRDASEEHFRAQLRAIDADAAAGRIGATEATAAKGEIARELIRLRGEAAPANPASGNRLLVALTAGLAAILALVAYAYLGQPDLPSEPLAQRAAETGAGLDLQTAVKTIEARLEQNPNDLRGWQVIAPAYMQLGRYADAVRALRQVNALATPTADSYTDLGEALMMQNGGSVAGEPLELFRKAAALDPRHVRSRYYIAGEETRSGDYAAAVRDWNALLRLGKGDEPWMTTARNGLAYAEAGLNPQASSSVPMATSAAPPAAANANAPQIEAMVDGLDARLQAQGGSIAEWTELVRSRMVQGRLADAQAAYDRARRAYPDPKSRTELDVLAADNGLVAR